MLAYQSYSRVNEKKAAHHLFLQFSFLNNNEAKLLKKTCIRKNGETVSNVHRESDDDNVDKRGVEYDACSEDGRSWNSSDQESNCPGNSYHATYARRGLASHDQGVSCG
ncbi:hypothetical protein AgCh_022456 [Apium graveolens]